MICNRFFSKESSFTSLEIICDALIKEFISIICELVVVEIESNFLNFPIVFRLEEVRKYLSSTSFASSFAPQVE